LLFPLQQLKGRKEEAILLKAARKEREVIRLPFLAVPIIEVNALWESKDKKCAWKRKLGQFEREGALNGLLYINIHRLAFVYKQTCLDTLVRIETFGSAC
jgi:hypothetical protein